MSTCHLYIIGLRKSQSNPKEEWSRCPQMGMMGIHNVLNATEPLPNGPWHRPTNRLRCTLRRLVIPGSIFSNGIFPINPKFQLPHECVVPLLAYSVPSVMSHSMRASHPSSSFPPSTGCDSAAVRGDRPPHSPPNRRWGAPEAPGHLIRRCVGALRRSQAFPIRSSLKTRFLVLFATPPRRRTIPPNPQGVGAESVVSPIDVPLCFVTIQRALSWTSVWGPGGWFLIWGGAAGGGVGV